ncbi:MAG: alpha-amylase [Butyrivibrio sp.]|nr:alpha-amylase [Butyrivibrio sp.]
MTMKKRVLAAFLVSAFILSACQGKSAPEADQADTDSQESVADTRETISSDAVAESNMQDSNNADSKNVESTVSTSSSENLPPLNVLDDKYRTTYEIFVYSFADSNGDGIGDLKGVTDKLDYINDGDDSTDTDLGCNQIWLMPIMPSPTYHKYDVVDYKDIDEQYGTLEDFDNLVKACHDRGIKVIIDLVLNHTSSEHPWFKEAKEYLKNHSELDSLYGENGGAIPEIESECPYVYYYNFTKQQQTGYEKVNGTDWYYEARFWSGMPDLNLSSTAVWNEITEITQFWTDRGVDGYRLDAVAYYYTDNNEQNIEFMTRFNDMVKSQNDNAYIVGEAWVAQSTYADYYTSGIDSFFDFDFSGSEGMIATVARGKKAPVLFAKAMAQEEELYESKNPDYVNAPFYTNHDMARSAGYFVGRGSDNMVKMSGALNLLMGGNAFVYYGEELGMKGSGKDENKRAPMQWTALGSGSADESIMCDGPKDMEKFEMPYPALDEQALDPYSIYNYYKKAIRLRNTFPVIARGKTEPIEVLSDETSGVGAFLRYGSTGLSSDSGDYIVFDENGDNIGMDGVVKPALGAKDPLYGEAALLILINNGKDTKTVDLSKWSGTGNNPELAFELNVGEESSALEGTTLTIPSYGIAVVK